MAVTERPAPTIGELIHEARRHAKLSQDELARRVGVSRVTLGTWERDEAVPDVRRWIALARATGQLWMLDLRPLQVRAATYTRKSPGEGDVPMEVDWLTVA